MLFCRRPCRAGSVASVRYQCGSEEEFTSVEKSEKWSKTNKKKKKKRRKKKKKKKKKENRKRDCATARRFKSSGTERKREEFE